MRVNFAFTTTLLAIFFVATAFEKDLDRDLRAKQVNVIIRQIGHQLLLQAGDSTSLVMPVTEIKEGTFLLRFENELVFSHDSLMMLSQQLLPKTQFPSGYTVTVQDCSKGDIVYGFQVNNTTPDILACRGRRQPRGCYTIEFTIHDFYENLKKQKAALVQPYKSISTDPQETNPKLAAVKTTTLLSDLQLTTSSSKSTALRYAALSGILLILGVAFFKMRLGKMSKPALIKNQEDAVTEEPATEQGALGKFLFSSKHQHLLLGSEVISLTDKENKVLDLLHKNIGELISRETLMQEIWLNEGVITGRSLDMFVSKLRKKLSGDPALSITNIHGKGYKLEVIAGQDI